MEWGFNEEELKFPGGKELRERFHKQLAERRHELPRLTKAQAEVVVTLMVDAYHEAHIEEHHERLASVHDRAMAGVAARRRMSKRQTIAAAFASAAAAGNEVSIEQLAADHGVSKQTVYRALKAKPAKPATKAKR